MNKELTKEENDMSSQDTMRNTSGKVILEQVEGQLVH